MDRVVISKMCQHSTCYFTTLLLLLIATQHTAWAQQSESSIQTSTLSPSAPTNSSTLTPDDSTSQPTTTSTQVEEQNRGMQWLYDIANKFLVALTPKGLPSELQYITDNNFTEVFENEGLKEELLQYSLGVIICVIIGVLFVVIMPITGLIFCCCRQCGNCGATQRKTDSASAPCKRTTFGVFTFILSVVLVFATVCMFFSNQYMQQGLHALPDKLASSVEKLGTYKTHISQDVDTVLVKDYDTLVNKPLKAALKHTRVDVLDKLGNVTQAAFVMANLTQLSAFATSTRHDLQSIRDDTNALQTLTQSLSWELHVVRSNISIVIGRLGSCQGDIKCELIVNASYNFELGMKAAPLLNVENVLNNLSEIIDRNFNSLTDEVNKKYEEIGDVIENETSGVIEDTEERLDDVGDALSDWSDRVQGVLDDSINTTVLASDTHEAVTRALEEDKYSKWLLIGVSSYIGLISIILLVGLMCVMCGRRAGSNGGGCDRGMAASCLMIPVFFMFLLSWAVMLVCMIMFLTGAITFLGVCEPLLDDRMTDSAQIKILDKILADQLVFSNQSVSIHEILTECPKDESIYNVLRLDSVFKLEEIETYKTKFNISQFTEGFSDIVFNLEGTHFLDEETRRELLNLADSGIDALNFSNNLEEFSKDVVMSRNTPPISLHDFTRLLSSYAMDKDNETKRKILEIMAQVDNFQPTYITPIQEIAERMNASIHNLNLNINLRRYIIKLINDIDTAEAFVKKEGADIIQQAILEKGEYVQMIIDKYVDHVIYQIKNEVGKCREALLAIDDGTDAVCVGVIFPLNGFWAALGWSLILFIPTIIFAVKLSSQCRKAESFTPLLTGNGSDIGYDPGYADNTITNGHYPSYDVPLQQSMPPPPHHYKSSSKVAPRHHTPYRDYNHSYEHHSYIEDHGGDRHQRSSSNHTPRHGGGDQSWHYKSTGYVSDGYTREPPPYQYHYY